MRLIGNPNFWSCLPASAAMILDIELKKLIEYIGHDGSGIVFPDLPEPGKRRGFHMQEIIPIAWSYGFAVTPIEARPCSTPDGKNEFEIEFPESLEDRFKIHLDGCRGIITGQRARWFHATAWSDGLIHDPIGKVYPYEEIEMGIDTFWRFDEIKSV